MNNEPIKLPVRWNANSEYIEEADGNEILNPLWSGDADFIEVGQHVVTCINSYPKLVAENKVLAEKVEKYEKVLKRYADEKMWFTPKVCNDLLHGHPGHECSKNWAFLYRWNGYDLAASVLERRTKDD